MDAYKYNNATTGLSLGHGGIYCPCCTKYPPAKQKRLMRRLARRNLKTKLAKEIDNG